MTKDYSIVLLGGSNSVMVNGLQKGLRGENVKLTNLALGSSISLQNLYELKRERNQESLREADLIITESNINEIANHHGYSFVPLSTILSSIHWLYEELYRLKKKVLILLLPYNPSLYQNATAIDNTHRICANRYGFNCIDMQGHYIKENIFGFYGIFGAHQMARLMNYFGQKIVQNLNEFKTPKQKIPCNANPEFRILTPREMQTSAGGGFDLINLQNSAFCEEAYLFQKGIKLQFPKNCAGWTLLGIHAWNNGKPKNQCGVYNVYSSIRVMTQNHQISKSSSLIRLFNTLNTPLLLDDKSCCAFDETNCYTEKSEAVILSPHSYTIPYFNLIDFFLAKGGKWDYEIPFNHANIIVESEYNFDFLIPDVKVIKEIIEEYCLTMRLTKSPPPKEATKEKVIIQGKPIPSIYLVAKDRIHSHLAYKLGSAMILNSKSLWGYMRMPYVLSYIKESHRKEIAEYQAKVAKNPKLKLPPLESYTDYEQALKEKECFTYKLGLALMQVDKTWYKGGYLRFYFLDVPRLRKEFRKKRK